MKLLMNAIIAKIEEMIIKDTRNIPITFPLSMLPKKGIIRPNTINNVNKTAMCAITLFSFLTPLLIATKINPTITGIRAVTGLESDSK